MQFGLCRIVVASIAATTLVAGAAAAQRGGAGGGRGGAAPIAVDSNPIFGVKPTFPTEDAVIKRIYANGMDSSWTKKLGHTFLDSIGPRLMGSDNLVRAQDWAVATYKSWGIDAKREIFGTWRGWRRGYSHIDLISPRVRSLTGTMLASSPGTNKMDVDAEVIILPLVADPAAFRAWLPQSKGKLVMISPAQPTCRLATDIRGFATNYTDSVYAAERQAAALDMAARVRNTGKSIGLGGGALGLALDSAGAAGIIISRPKDNAGNAMEIFDSWNEKAAAITLTCEDYGLVFRLAESGSKPVIRMNLDAEFLGERPVANVIGTIRGTEKPDEVVMLSAHFDSWDGSSGATDNGTGTLMMMEAMRILKKSYPNPKRTIMIGHWSGEEQGLVGSAAWAADHPEINAKITAFFNQDNGTGRVNSIGGAGFLSGATLIPSWIDRMPSNMRANFRFSGVGSPSRGGQGGGTDTGSFACYVVPTFNLGGATNWNYNGLTWHTDKDTWDKVSFDDLRWNATVVAMLAYMAADDPKFLTRNTLAQNDSMWSAGGGGRGGAGAAPGAGAGAGAGRGGAAAAGAGGAGAGAGRGGAAAAGAGAAAAGAGRGGAAGGAGARGGAAAASTAPAGTVLPCPAPVRKTNPRM